MQAWQMQACAPLFPPVIVVTENRPNYKTNASKHKDEFTCISWNAIIWSKRRSYNKDDISKVKRSLRQFYIFTEHAEMHKNGT